MIFSDQALSKRIEYAEALANVEIVESHANLQPESGATWIKTAGSYVLFDGEHSPCTQTFGLGICEEASMDDLKKIDDFFKLKNAPVLHEVSPLTDPSLLCLLRDRSYYPVEYSNVMFQSLESPLQINSTLNPNIRVRITKNDEIKL